MRIAFGNPLANPKEGDRHLFMKFAWLPMSLSCGCVIWFQRYAKGMKFGQSLDEILHGIRPRWAYGTNCVPCLEKAAGEKIHQVIRKEQEDGVTIHMSKKLRWKMLGE